jgi:SpoIID/LytB domain protein
MDAVLGTAGKVLTYDGEIITAFYSSSMGGVSVSAQDAWGGKNDIPYLQAVETPWENYMVHNNAFWMVEISPEALLDRLHTAGYTQLEDAIEDVEIVALAKNSTYVKTLRVTDIHGTDIEINYTDKVRTSLTPYVKSANFVVGKGEVEYTENVIVVYEEEDESEASE